MAMIVATIISEVGKEQSKAELIKSSLNNLVLIGEKISSKEMDDPYVARCGNACAKKLNVASVKVSTGKEFIASLERAGKISTCVFWGHSWSIGLYMQDNQGFYRDNLQNKDDYANFSHLKKSNLRTEKHSLFIFASCGTATDDQISNKYSETSFAARFGYFINKSEEPISNYKITTIGSTGLSNLLLDGTVKTDGVFIKIERNFRIEKKPIYKTVVEGWIFKEKKEVLDRWKNEVIIDNVKITRLGKKIDPAEIIKNHNSNDTTIK